MTKRILVLFFLLTLPAPGYSKIPKKYTDYFKLHRDSNGKLEKISIKKQTNKLMAHQVQVMQLTLSDLIANNELNYQSFAKDLDSFQGWTKDDKRAVKKSLKRLNDYEVAKHLSDPELKELARKIDKKIMDAFPYFNVLAMPNDSSYFYKREVIQEVFKLCLDLISESTLSPVGVNIVKHLLNQTFRNLKDRVYFYQEYFIYYLHEKGPEALGLKDKEMAHVMSSIFEYRIDWYEVWETIDAQNNWMKYGFKQFGKDVIKADKRLDKLVHSGALLENRLDYAFAHVTKKGQEYIYNVGTRRSLFNNKASLAFSFEHPKLTLMKRIKYQLIHFGADMIDVPFVMAAFKYYLRRKYIPQRRREGALAMSFLMFNELDNFKTTIEQSVNPILISDFF